MDLKPLAELLAREAVETILDSDWFREAKAEAWDEGWAAYHAYYEANTSDSRDNPYRD